MFSLIKLSSIRLLNFRFSCKENELSLENQIKCLYFHVPCDFKNSNLISNLLGPIQLRLRILQSLRSYLVEMSVISGDYNLVKNLLDSDHDHYNWLKFYRHKLFSAKSEDK